MCGTTFKDVYKAGIPLGHDDFKSREELPLVVPAQCEQELQRFPDSSPPGDA